MAFLDVDNSKHASLPPLNWQDEDGRRDVQDVDAGERNLLQGVKGAEKSEHVQGGQENTLSKMECDDAGKERMMTLEVDASLRGMVGRESCASVIEIER